MAMKRKEKGTSKSGAKSGKSKEVVKDLSPRRAGEVKGGAFDAMRGRGGRGGGRGGRGGHG